MKLKQRRLVNRQYLMLALGLFSSITVLQVAGISLFLLIIYCYLFYIIFFNKNFIVINSPFLPFLIAATVSACLSTYLNLSDGYVVNNLKGLLNFFAVFLTSSTLISLINAKEFAALLTGLQWSCRIQVLWIILQTIFWTLWEFDINQFIFADLLHMVDKASQFKGTGYVPTGLCWNAGGIAPILFFGFFLEKRLVFKIFVITGALLTQSATLTVGIILCGIINLLLSLRNTQKKFKFGNKKSIFVSLFIILLFGLCLYLFSANIMQQFTRLWEVFSYRLAGLMDTNSTLDSSTSAHLGYFVNLPSVLAAGSIVTFLLGYGVNCSGFPYSAVVGQYAGETWIVECDITNIILNFGIIGFIFFYIWIIDGICKLHGKRSYIVWPIVVIAIMGVTYNLQYIWVIFIELLIFSSKEKRMLNTSSASFIA